MLKRLTVSTSANSPLSMEKRPCMSSSSLRTTRRSAQITEVTPFLLISDDRTSENDLVAFGITAIIDCRTESEVDLRGPCGSNLQLKRLHLPLKDNKAEDASKYFVHAIYFIEQQRKANGRVLVHCTKGISRSSAIVCSYLIWSENVCFRGALAKLRETHEIAEPNPSFAFQLMEFSTSQSKGTIAYQVIDDGKALTGPLMEKCVNDACSTMSNNPVIIISRATNCVFILLPTEMAITNATKTCEMLSSLQLASETRTILSYDEYMAGGFAGAEHLKQAVRDM